LNIALCVNLKAINKDIAFFDTCFGFESAVEETQRFIEEGYALCKSNYNSVGKEGYI
jgi:6-phosphofructokinase